MCLALLNSYRNIWIFMQNISETNTIYIIATLKTLLVTLSFWISLYFTIINIFFYPSNWKISIPFNQTMRVCLQVNHIPIKSLSLIFSSGKNPLLLNCKNLITLSSPITKASFYYSASLVLLMSSFSSACPLATSSHSVYGTSTSDVLLVKQVQLFSENCIWTCKSLRESSFFCFWKQRFVWKDSNK